MNTLLITPPLTDWNAPYPAISYLAQFLRRNGYPVAQLDASIQLIHKIYSAEGLQTLRSELLTKTNGISVSAASFLEFFEEIFLKVPLAVRYLESVDPLLEHIINQPSFLNSKLLSIQDLSYLYSNLKLSPDVPVARALASALGPFGTLGASDRARYIATLLLKTITRVIQENLDSHLGFASYGAEIDKGATSFGVFLEELGRPRTLITRMADQIANDALKKYQPDVIGITVPFAGNVLGALTLSRAFKTQKPGLRIVLGGGYVNTQLRNLSSPELFQFVDHVTLDDGEKPLLNLLQKWRTPGVETPVRLSQTYSLLNSKVVFSGSHGMVNAGMAETGFPDYKGLDRNQYLKVLDQLHPMHQIWTGANWNKLTLAHGCYWKQCAFCDTHLDYVHRYETTPIEKVLDRIELLTQQTGLYGFHFVDEAIPPTVARKLSEGLIQRKIHISWWGNIRFDKAFTPELARLMAAAGCVAVTAGLESATDRILELMKKGTTSQQIALVSDNLSKAKILVHTYLIYGFPGQSLQECVDDLEFVRQLFKAGNIVSGVWHKLTTTLSSDIGKNPEAFGLTVSDRPLTDFSNYVVPHTDSLELPVREVGLALERALKNYLHGNDLDIPANAWFAKYLNAPKTRWRLDHVRRLIQKGQKGRSPAKTKVHDHPQGGQGHIRKRAMHGRSKKKNNVSTLKVSGHPV